MTSQPGEQKIVIHILTNISESKGNQTMKFGQLIECNMRNIFIEKSSTKYGGVISFEVNLIFLIKPFFLNDQKVVTETYIS